MAGEAPYHPLVISLRRPTSSEIAEYRLRRLLSDPTCAPSPTPPPGFRSERFSRRIGVGDADYERGRAGLAQWRAHRSSGVDVFPPTAQVALGETVAIVTRQLGVWVLAACRISSVVDEVDAFGFTYSTLPDHPECGYESFTVSRASDQVRFVIEAVSKPGVLLVRLGQPVTRQLQKRAANAYLDALARWTAASP